MNPLQEYPHLFANGKFKIEIHYRKDHKPIIPLDHYSLSDAVHYPNHCTLIARPISDMTIPEAHEAIKLLDYDASADEYRALISVHNKLDQALYLLSIGVYPFDQSHFDDGTVIDSTTL